MLEIKDLLRTYGPDHLSEIKDFIEELLKGHEKPVENLCHNIKFIEGENTVSTISPYNNCFVTKARGLKGSFKDGRWVFQKSVSAHVKMAMQKCYGVTGEVPYSVCTLLVKNWDSHTYGGGLELFGFPVAKAYGRDSGAKSGDDIFLLEGKFTSGGSVKNWSTKAVDATFEMHNIPAVLLESDEVKKAIEEGWVEIVFSNK